MSSVATNLLRVPLLGAETASGKTSEPINCLPYPHVTVYVIGEGTTSSGTVIIETADFNPSTERTYSGTWAELATVNASDVNSDKQKAVSFTARAYSQVRTRIGTVIGGGGTISTVLVAG